MERGGSLAEANEAHRQRFHKEVQRRKMNDNKVVEIKNLIKSYGARDFQTTVLKGIDLTIYKDDFIAIMGPSGSGKTAAPKHLIHDRQAHTGLGHARRA